MEHCYGHCLTNNIMNGLELIVNKDKSDYYLHLATIAGFCVGDCQRLLFLIADNMRRMPQFNFLQSF